MGAQDKRSAATPLNTFKQDYSIVSWQAGRGSTGGLATGVTRFTFWLDYDPFNVNTRSVTWQNLNFQVFSDSLLTQPIYPYVLASQTNDLPDEMFTLGMTPAKQQVFQPTQNGSLLLPPYNVVTTLLSQPINNNYLYDQGLYTIYGNAGQGYAIGTSMFGQGFIPQQSLLTGFAFPIIARTASTDHTTYRPITFELWDANKNFYATLGTLQPTYTNGTLAATGFTIGTFGANATRTVSSSVADDSVTYWNTLNYSEFILNTPIATTPGALYYIMARQTKPAGTTDYYIIGANINGSNLYSGTGRYSGYDLTGALNTNAHAVYAPDGSSTFTHITDTQGFPIDLLFITKGNVGRMGVTFYWGNQTQAYWSGPPATNQGRFKFVHVDYDQRI